MPKISLLYIIFFLLWNHAFGQELSRLFRNNVIPVSSISVDSIDFQDLSSLGEAIKNCRIVMLGEATHGDSLTPLAKTRIVKYLHEVHGFDVLCFESDFYALNRVGVDSVRGDSNYIADNVLEILSRNQSYNHLFYDYIPKCQKTNHPLIISGIDNQLSGIYSINNFSNDMKLFLSSLENYNIFVKEEQTSFLNLVNDSFFDYRIADTLKLIKIKESVEYFEDLLCNIPQLLNAFEMRCLINLKTLCIGRLLNIREDNIISLSNIRDKQMFQNLHWLITEKYFDKKIIVWAHNLHIYKGPPPPIYKDFKFMGEYLSEVPDFRDKMYVIAFTSSEGFSCLSYYEKSVYKISIMHRRSLERWIPNHFDYAFINAKDAKFNKVRSKHFFAKFGHYINIKHKWIEGIDGIFYIKKMYPTSY